MTIHCLDFSADDGFTVDVVGNAAARLNNSGMSIVGLFEAATGFGVTPWLAMAGNVGIWNAFFAGVAAGTGGFTGIGVLADSGVPRGRGVMASGDHVAPGLIELHPHPAYIELLE